MASEKAAPVLNGDAVAPRTTDTPGQRITEKDPLPNGPATPLENGFVTPLERPEGTRTRSGDVLGSPLREERLSHVFSPASAPQSSAPPSLNYSMKGRKRWAFGFWFIVIFDTVAIPLAVYFGLWYGVGPAKCPTLPGASHQEADCPESRLSANAVFSISTACLGGISIFEYFLRFYRLWRKGSTCRVIGARRSYLDWFHWNYSIAWIFIMIELIVGTVPEWPPIRLLAMPAPSLLFWFSFQMLVVDTLRLMGKTSPVRISSMPKGTYYRPAIYSIIEDVIAVDGSGGTEFRTALNERFEQSHYFRQMLHRLTLWWAIGAMLAAAATTALVFTLERDAAYVVGWVLPFLWAGVWAAGTYWYVRRELAHERREWSKPKATRNYGRYSIDQSRVSREVRRGTSRANTDLEAQAAAARANDGAPPVPPVPHPAPTGESEEQEPEEETSPVQH